MGIPKDGIKYEDVITRHQPHMMKGDNAASVNHGKDLYPKKYGVVDLRRECDKGDMGTKGRENLYPEVKLNRV